MTQSELIGLLKDLQAIPRESEWVEFKVNNTSREEIGEYISALSNSACYNNEKYGFLVFGVENATHNLVGTNYKPKDDKIGNQEVENWWATQLDPRIDFEIFEFTYNEMNFVIIRIDATRHTPVTFRGKAWIRIGSYKKSLHDHPEKERKIWNKQANYIFEYEIAAGRLTEIEALKMIDCEAFFKSIGMVIPENRSSIISRLLEEKLIVSEEDGFAITNLGGLLFAKDLNQFGYLARKAIRVIVYEGKNRIRTIKEQDGVKGYAVGFEGLIKYISDLLASHETIEAGIRKQVFHYPIIAVRELVANSIIHQDFGVKGASPMIEIFENRIEFTNPGKPLIDTKRFLDHSPESRNEVFARFMRRLNICEERGSGIDKVVFECEYLQLPAPEFIMGDNYTRVILHRHKKFRDMDKNDKVRACYLHACLKYVSGEYMSNQSLRHRFGIEEHNYSIASRIIADTISEGLIRDYDEESKSRKYAKYLPYWA